MKWTLVTRKLSELVDFKHNPRQITEHDYEKLCDSIKKFGFSEKIVINTDNTIIGGHQRKRALEDLDFYVVDCWIPDRLLTQAEVTELNVRFNRNSGNWDWDILANFFEPDDLCEWGFHEEELLNETKASKKKRKQKPAITFAFEFPDDLCNFIEELKGEDKRDLQSLAAMYNGKIKLRGLEVK